MHQETKDVAKYMYHFAFNILGRALYDVTFNEMMSPFSHTLAIVHAAHGAEILLKARIAEEHPLLIFKNLPKSKTTNGLLSIKELFEYGHTHMYSELPEILWATTGYRINKLENYQRFGVIRNQVMHFAAPPIDASTETLKYLLEVIDPISQDLCNESFVSFSQNWDDVIIAEGYLQEQIKQANIELHPKTKQEIEEIGQGT